MVNTQGAGMRGVFLGLAAILTLAAAPAWANIGRIKSATGAAHIERNGAKVPIKPGVIVLAGDTLVTPKASRIGVTFIDNSRVSAGPGTRFTIGAYDYNDTTREGRFIARLAKGAVAIVSGHIARSAPDAMRVSTPRNVFAIRGARVVLRVR
jgi:hypothetical protein